MNLTPWPNWTAFFLFWIPLNNYDRHSLYLWIRRLFMGRPRR